MTAYAYYRWERLEYRDLYNIGLDVCAAQKIHAKLARHFKLEFYDFDEKKYMPPKLIISNRFHNGRGIAYNNFSVKVGRRTTLGVLAHEIAHLLNRKHNTGMYHDRSFKRWHKKVVTYVRARDYFGLLATIGSAP
jgi:hypothetical protein